MKKIQKISFILLVLFFTFSMFSSVLASNIAINTTDNSNINEITNDQEETNNIIGNTSLEVVEDNICTIEVEDLATFEKKITEFNEKEKSVTLTLNLTNNKTVEEAQKDVEIFFVIDNSLSMTQNYIGDETRKQAVIDSANSLVDKLYSINNNIKIGVVGFSSLDSSKGETEGTINDASLRLNLTDSKDEVKKAISGLSALAVGPRTNIEAGLTLADENFSSDESIAKYLVLLTDGLPNNAIDGTFGEYSDNVISRTKTKLEEIESKGIQIIGAMINLSNEDSEVTPGKTYKELSEEIFGTEENPSISKYFYIPDGEIEDTIVNDIFNSLILTIDNTLKNITITDYFPQEIIDNFNFEYVASPNIGEVSQTIDPENNSITWNIELLSEGETASLSYKLTLKDDYDKEIINQVLKTNTHVDITGDNNGNTLKETSDVSPTIRVLYEDKTIAKDPIPQTGQKSFIGFITIVSILSIIIIFRLEYLKRNSIK